MLPESCAVLNGFKLVYLFFITCFHFNVTFIIVLFVEFFDCSFVDLMTGAVEPPFEDLPSDWEAAEWPYQLILHFGPWMSFPGPPARFDVSSCRVP